MYAIEVWVANQDEVGNDADYTFGYIDASGWEVPQYVGYLRHQQILAAADPDRLWRAFRTLATAVAEAGHGGDTADCPPPVLVACLVGAEGAARSLQQQESVDAITWDDWLQ